MSVCKAWGKLGGPGACSPREFRFLTLNRHNLVESGTFFFPYIVRKSDMGELTFYVEKTGC